MTFFAKSFGRIPTKQVFLVVVGLVETMFYSFETFASSFKEEHFSDGLADFSNEGQLSERNF